MDLTFVNERIAALERARDECHCDSRDGYFLRAIANALIRSYALIRQQIIEAAERGITDRLPTCDCNANL